MHDAAAQDTQRSQAYRHAAGAPLPGDDAADARRPGERHRLVAVMIVLAAWLGWMIPATGALVPSPGSDAATGLRLQHLHRDALDRHPGRPVAVIAAPPPGCACDDSRAQRTVLIDALTEARIAVVDDHGAEPVSGTGPGVEALGRHHYPLTVFDARHRLVFAGPVAGRDCGGSPRLRVRQLTRWLDGPERDLIQPACLCKD